MKIVPQSRRCCLCSVLLLAAFLSFPARALVYEYQFGDMFNGTITPANTNAPWFTARFEDVVPGTVKLTMSILSLTNTENVDEMYFNLNPSLQPTSLSLSYQSSTGSFDLPTIEKGTDGYKADGDGLYDLHFIYASGGDLSNWFSGGDSAVYLITGTNLSAADFRYQSAPAGGSGPFYAAAHVQRLGVNANKSSWFDPTDNTYQIVPEPSTGTLWIFALGTFVSLRLFRRPTLRPSRVAPLDRRRV